MALGSLSKKHDRLWRKHYLNGVEKLQQAYDEHVAGRCWQATMGAHLAAQEAAKAVAHVEADRTAKRGARLMAHGLLNTAFSAQVAIGQKCILHESPKGSSESEFRWFVTHARIDVAHLRESWGIKGGR